MAAKKKKQQRKPAGKKAVKKTTGSKGRRVTKKTPAKKKAAKKATTKKKSVRKPATKKKVVKKARKKVSKKKPAFGWGGARPGAGRPPKGDKPMASHAKKGALPKGCPLLVTTPLRPGLPSLRRTREYEILREQFELGCDRFGFRLCHYSVGKDHYHMICEAPNRNAMSRGLQGLTIRIARALNRHWGRKGKVFSDHYDERSLETPQEVRQGLVFVLNNAKRLKYRPASKIDLYSSGPWFDGWKGSAKASGHEDWELPIVQPRFALLKSSWRRLGKISPTEIQQPLKRRSAFD